MDRGHVTAFGQWWIGILDGRGAAGRRLALAVLATAAVGIGPAFAQPPPAAKPVAAELRPQLTGVPPVIDGLLDDEAWRQAAMPTGDWLSYNPLHGDKIPQQTTVWVTYDTGYLYFAFKCDDPDPAGIKTSVTRRDNIWQDDWVGLSLDALGTGQLSYHMLVNPSGVQLDMLNSVAGEEDEAPDWVWESAGRLTPTGYVVEIRLPLQSIRFKGGDNARMGILFWRRVSRIGVSVSWPALAPGTWVFERHAPLVFDRIQPRLPREVIPSTTYVRTQRRDTPARWGSADGNGDIGISTKMGISSTVTIDATLNPDFSQVESDAFQVEVNQRFPIFFSEKRPFFMEGAGIFAIAGAGNDNSLQTAVHTRKIIDPIFGAKVTGSSGRLTFGTLSAVDQSAGRGLPDGSPDAGKDRVFNIARAQYSLGPSNYVGALVTDTEFAGGHNRVAGSDFTWRVSPAQRVNAFLFGSWSREPHAARARSGVGAQAGYLYSTRNWTGEGYVEHYDRDFQMDTAFINRVGITSGWAFIDRSFYPDKAKYPWLRRVRVFSFTQGGRDRIAGGQDLVEVAGLRLNFTRQGFFRIDREAGFEPWAGRRFTRGRTRVQGEVQLYRWLYLEGQFSTGRAIFYDSTDPFAGRSRDTSVEVTLQPNGRLSQALNYRHITFDRASTGERVYDLDIIYSRTTYQFTRQFFLRGIVQYDSSRARVLTDFLTSYELRPGTVAYLGYGSLIEQRDFVDGRWVPGEGQYRTTQRGLFFKASYLYRF